MTSSNAPIRTAGLALGLAVAALLVLAFRVPASGQSLGAGIRITATAPGELHVPSTDPVLSARGLVPGGEPARGSLPVTNVTRGAVSVRLRVRPDSPDLDRNLRVELTSGERKLASGPLASLRRWTRAVRIERADERTIRVRAWIPNGAQNSAGRRVAAQLQLDARLVRDARR